MSWRDTLRNTRTTRGAAAGLGAGVGAGAGGGGSIQSVVGAVRGLLKRAGSTRPAQGQDDTHGEASEVR